jgi:hypothetical protein
MSDRAVRLDGHPIRARVAGVDVHPRSGIPLVQPRKGPLVLSLRTTRRATVACIAACGLVTAPANAATTPGDAGCPVVPTTTPFAPWGDEAQYLLAPGGDVEEHGATWALTGGARAVEGSEPFGVGAAGDHVALGLPAGSSATTARMCIGVEHRTLRFFAAASRRSGSLKVEVLYAGRARTVGTIGAATAWAPTDALPMVVNELAPAQGNAIQVALRFTPRGNASWSVDDVYVDPFRSR